MINSIYHKLRGYPNQCFSIFHILYQSLYLKHIQNPLSNKTWIYVNEIKNSISVSAITSRTFRRHARPDLVPVELPGSKEMINEAM